MQISHRNATHHGTDDAYIALVSSAQEQILQMGSTVEPFIRSTIDGPVVVPREPANRRWSKQIHIDHKPSKIGYEPDTRIDAAIVPFQFLPTIIRLIQLLPTIEIGNRRDANYPIA
jgi:hypothetical protein